MSWMHLKVLIITEKGEQKEEQSKYKVAEQSAL